MADLDSVPLFNVVIAYEDFETGTHAKSTYDCLVENLGQDCQFTNQMWKFDVLVMPKLREMAVADVRAADIVIISCRGAELPNPVKNWLETSLSRRGKPLALVALIDRWREDPVSSRLLRAYLAVLARRGHMEFFAAPEEPAGKSGHSALPGREDLDSTPCGRTLSALAGVVQRDVGAPPISIYD